MLTIAINIDDRCMLFLFIRYSQLNSLSQNLLLECRWYVTSNALSAEVPPRLCECSESRERMYITRFRSLSNSDAVLAQLTRSTVLAHEWAHICLGPDDIKATGEDQPFLQCGGAHVRFVKLERKVG